MGYDFCANQLDLAIVPLGMWGETKGLSFIVSLPAHNVICSWTGSSYGVQDHQRPRRILLNRAFSRVGLLADLFAIRPSVCSVVLDIRCSGGSRSPSSVFLAGLRNSSATVTPSCPSSSRSPCPTTAS